LNNRKKVLIIGGLGFLGKNLYLRLKKNGYAVHILSDVLPDPADYFISLADSNDIVRGDFRDTKLLSELIPRYFCILCFAGLSGAKSSLERPIIDSEVNCTTHLQFLEICKKHNPDINIVFPSTRLVYGKPGYLPVDEKHPLNPESFYAVHKITAEYYYRIYYNIFNIKSVILRISNPYGPFQKFGEIQYGILNWFIYKALKKEEIQLFGRGEQKRDYLFIDDLSALILRFLKMPELFDGSIYNVGYGKGISLYEAVVTLKKYIPDLFYNTVPWPDTEKKIETGDYYSDLGAIKQKTGWQPQFSFDEGIRRTVEFYQKTLHI